MMKLGRSRIPIKNPDVMQHNQPPMPFEERRDMVCIVCVIVVCMGFIINSVVFWLVASGLGVATIVWCIRRRQKEREGLSVLPADTELLNLLESSS